MKSFRLKVMAMLALAALVLVSCHSTEANYRAAYDKALERQQENIGVEAYEKIQAEMNRSTTVVNGDSVRLVPMFCNVTDDSATVAHTYNVVVASFRQLVNAQSYRDRLITKEGYRSYLLYGGQPDQKYFVIVKGFDDLDVAAAFVKRIDQYVKIKILEPRVWILQKL